MWKIVTPKERCNQTIQPVQVPKSIKQPTQKQNKTGRLIWILRRHGTRIKLAKVRLGLCEKGIRFAILNNATSIQDNDTIKVKDCVKFVSDSDDGVITEFLSNNTLHDFICFGIDTIFQKKGG